MSRKNIGWIWWLGGLLVSLLMTSYGGKGCLYDVMCMRAGVVNGIAKLGLKSGEHLIKDY